MDGTQIRLDEIEEGAEYKAFIEKFKPKKTTDDCYTPENIYQVVADYVTETYGDKQPFVRPFWPDGDYEREEYPEGCAVVDNPPFSILSRIVSFYQRRKIRFFSVRAHAHAVHELRKRGVLCAVRREHHICKRRGREHQLYHQHGRRAARDRAEALRGDQRDE